MPGLPLASSLLQTAFAQYLALDEQSGDKLRPLFDKQLAVKLHELPWHLVFVFSQNADQQGDVQIMLLDEQQRAEHQVDSSITLSLEVLNKLKDASQITRLIQQHKLALDGDIKVAQHFAEVMNSLDIDWPEIISRYIGDAATHQLFYQVDNWRMKAKSHGEHIVNMLKEGAIEEKKLAASPIAVTHFSDQVNDLRSDCERLYARLSRLEKRVE